WGNSITEDFQLTLKLYEKGYKVVYTPYVQAPAEAVSTIKRLIRQRMRWAEGHSYNVKRMFGRLIFGRWEAVKSITGTTGNEGSIDAEARDTRDTLDTRGTHRVWVPSPLTPSEKLEFAYLTPYYLQAAFFIAGTISWFIAEVIFQVRLPFWTEVWGWSLILTNMLALPLMNMVGLFLEEAEEKDYLGLFSFVALSYVVAPFQAYAAVKGFLESQEGPWFRTPKTGRITDVFTPGRFYRFVWGVFGRGKPAVSPALGMGWQGRALPAVGLTSNPVFAFATANNSFQNFKIRRRHIRWVGNVSLIVLLLTTMLLTGLAPFVPASSYATQPEIKTVKSANSQKDEPTEPESIEEITTPVAVRFEAGNGEMLEMIFHRDPRVRIKLGEKELDITTQEIQGVGRANPVRSLFVDKKEVRYEEIVPGVDLVYRLHRKGFSEEFVIKRPLRFNGVKQKVTAKELEIIGPTPGTFEIYDKSGREVFRFGSAFLAEKEDLVKKSTDVSLTINKKIEGYELVKTIGEAGKIWLAAAERIYPVILDPPVTIVGSGYANGTADYGGIQRKLVFMETRDRYYAVANVSSSIQLWISDDNTGSAWTQLADIDDDNDDHDPTIVKDGDNFWIAWNDQSNDNPQFRRITTDASSETYEAVCTGPDMGAVGAIDVNAFGVASTYLYFYSDNDPDVYRITKSEYPGSCESTDFTSITNTTDGPIAGGEGAFQVTTGDELHAIWRTTSGIRHGIYSGSAWNTSAPFTVNSFNSDEFSVVKDSSNNLYVSAEAAAGEVHVYKCSATCTGTWSDLGTAMLDTDCASGYTDVTMNSLTYDSTNDDLILFAIATDATNERACFRASSDMGSNWESTTWDLGYVSADLNYLSSIHTVADPTKAAITIRNAATYSFATVPEKSLFLLFSLPFLSAILGELKKRKL
ncbi:MAG: Glycosyl transferase family 2, partial [Candidatus Levybacteria bacterium GW2011_GWA1_39_11]